MSQGSSEKLLDAVIATGEGPARFPRSEKRTFQAYGTTSSGSGAAAINVEVRDHDDAPWQVLGTISLTLSTTSVGDGFASVAPWQQVRGNVTSISGTDAAVTLLLGVQ